MKKQLPVMRTKLYPPAVKESIILKAGLSKKMKAIPEFPLILIHANAGYGKSTALSIYMKEIKVRYCWYSISSTDDDIFSFLKGLIASLQTVKPNFGNNLLLLLNDTYLNNGKELDILCSWFVNEWLRAKDDIVVILDDYQMVEHSTSINRWMEILLEHMPEKLHLVISGRSKPSWMPLPKLMASGKVLEITKSDLALSRTEIEWFLCENSRVSVNDELLEELLQLTEGWPIALQYFTRKLQKVDSLTLVSLATVPLKDLYDYFTKEVFLKLPRNLRIFLEQTGIFTEFSEQTCSIVLNNNNAAHFLKKLEEGNLFIEKTRQGNFRYHPLFKRFLEEELKNSRPQHYKRLHITYAKYCEKHNKWEQALIHYEKINDTHRLSNLLQKFGVKLLEKGKLEELSNRLKRVPDKEKKQHNMLWFLEGEVLRYRSFYNEAEAAYTNAFIRAAEKKDYKGMYRALEGKAKIYLDTIQPERAESFLQEALLIREEINDISNGEAAKLDRLLAENFINAGQAKKAERWMEKVTFLKERLNDAPLLARYYLRKGKLKEARKVLQALKEKNIHSSSSLPQSHRESKLLLALINVFKGESYEAERLAREGLKFGENIRSPFVEAVGWIRLGHAFQLYRQEDVSMADECYHNALDIMDGLHVERGKAEPYMGLCLLYAHLGQYDRAIEAGDHALQETEKVKDFWLSSFITLSLGIASFYAKHFKNAASSFEQAEVYFWKCDDQYGQMLSALWQTCCCFQLNHKEHFKRKVEQFLQRVQGEYEFVFYKRTLFGPNDLQILVPILLLAQKENIKSSFIQKIIQKKGLGYIKSHPGYTLRICMLGGFKVWRGDKEVTEKDWQRGKAKALFQLLAANFPQMLEKEDIIQILWSCQEKKNADRDFKVALNALNNAIEPNRKAREVPFFVIRDGGAYGLNPAASIELDSEFFKYWSKLGLEEDDDKAISFLERGLSLYKGDFLGERRYDDWCLNERERLLVLFLRSAEKLSQIYVRKEEYDEAIYWCEKIIEKEQTWEEAYRLLMYCYYKKNNRPFAIKWYRRCSEILKKELGVIPLEPTEQMYEIIVEAETDLNFK